MTTQIKELIKRSCRGDETAQFALVRQYSARLLSICRRYARDDSMARDMLQESWLRIFRGLPDFRYAGPFEGWICRIAVNTSLQWLKRKHIRTEASIVELEEPKGIAPAILTQLNTQDILYLVNQLPGGFKEVFNLFVIDGYSHREIAELLDITEGASRTLLLRARRRLQQQIQLLDTKKTAI